MTYVDKFDDDNDDFGDYDSNSMTGARDTAVDGTSPGVWPRACHPSLLLKAANFVDKLNRVPIASIAPEDRMCPYCWGEFDVVDEEVSKPKISRYAPAEPLAEATVKALTVPQRPESTRELLHQILEQLACAERMSDHDAVALHYGHLFGKQCLTSILESGERLCPKCRRIMVKKE